MTLVVLYHTAQTACNKPAASEAYNFKDSAAPTLSFSFDSRSISTGDTFGYYADNGKGQWERGLGTWDDTAKTITRTTVRESSTGSAIDWAYWGINPVVWSDGRQDEDNTAGAGVTDGDKGDITVSGSGAVWTIDNGLDATKIGAGSVSNTEFGYLDGVTSSIQTQLGTKATEGTAVAFTSVNINGTNGNGHIHLKHQTVDPSTTGSSTTLFANSSGNLSWINDGITRVTLDSSAHSSNWTYILPNKQGTIALTSDIPTFSVIQVDFGATETNTTTYTVNDPNITNDNLIIPTLAYYDTADHTAEEALCEGITVCASNVIDNTSYDIIAFAPNCTWGRYYINVEVI